MAFRSLCGPSNLLGLLGKSTNRWSTTFTQNIVLGDGTALGVGTIAHDTGTPALPTIKYDSSINKWVMSNSTTDYVFQEIGGAGNALPLTGGTLSGNLIFERDNIVVGSIVSVYDSEGPSSLLKIIGEDNLLISCGSDATTTAILIDKQDGEIKFTAGGNTNTVIIDDTGLHGDITLTTPRLFTINGVSKSFTGASNLSWTIEELGFADATHTHPKPTRTLTIGSTSRIDDGTPDLTWSLTDIGAASLSHTHNYLQLSGGTMTGSLIMSGGVIRPSVDNTRTVGTAEYRFGNIYSTVITGDLVGNADSASQADQLTTARTITIGNTGKLFDGSSDVTWTLAEIGATGGGGTGSYLPLTGGTLTGDLLFNDTTTYMGKITTINNLTHGKTLQVEAVDSIILYGGTLGVQDISFEMVNTSTDHEFRFKTDGTLLGTINSNGFVGNASTASTLATARTLTIGTSGKLFDGSANVSWGLSEIGAAAISHTHTASHITDATVVSAAGNIPKANSVGYIDASYLPVIRYGTAAPDDSVGKNGDIYIQIV